MAKQLRSINWMMRKAGVFRSVALEEEAVHAGGGQVAEDEDADREGETEPAQGAMQGHVVGAHQRGLENEEEHPTGKDDGVDGEYEGRYGRGVQQVLPDGVAEAIDHDHGNQQRHAEVKVLAQESSRGGVRVRESYGPGRHKGAPDGARGVMSFVMTRNTSISHLSMHENVSQWDGGHRDGAA